MIRALALVVVFACSREHRDEPARAIPCTSDRDCPALAAGSTCSYACGPDVCQLVTLGARAGDGPCFGNHREGAQAIAIQTASRVVVACDVDAGLYCERGSKHCAPSKPIGAGCREDDECGSEGRCDDDRGSCVAAHRAGESCRTERCASALYCAASTTCTARHELGASCDFADECGSLACERGRCVAPPTPVACPIAT